MENFVFKKKFGQNFISDRNLLNAIASDADITANDEVLEIGAGAGSLTQVLSQRAKKVVSFEIDKDLQEHLKSLNLSNVEFVFGDFMDFDLCEVEKKFSKNYKVVANLPYYITTPIIFKFLEEAKNLDSLTIMVQKEVAERVCADVGGKDYGILTVMTNFYGTPKITRIINRQMFYPVPNVDSALLHIKLEKKFPNIDSQKFSKFVKTCFAMRRKTLLNNLAPYGKEKLKSLFDEKTLQRRAESFSLEELVSIFEKL
ncbi:MAG: 16S rRNA (adenine(1518)-N(6)/adenine(1519)-N(6))-dimethyltransferase RsmA [Candidatus Caccovivens sp.]